MDLRAPVGALFLILGAMLALYGTVSGDRAETHLGYNVNLWWGGAMFVFGAAMAGAARLSSGRRRKAVSARRSSKEAAAGARR